MLLSHVIFEYTVIRLDLVEKSMPTGSKNSDVLLGWILDSLGLVKRKIESWGEEEEFGALHRIMSEALLLEPLKGWDIKTLGDVCGLSQTGMHHQILKLRESGLISSENYGRWHIYVLRGGTITSAINLMAVQAKEIIELRLLELSSHIKDSEKRMEILELEPLTDAISEAKLKAARHGLTMMEHKINGSIKDIAVLIDSYENIKEKWGIDEWDEESFEREEKRHHVRRGFELMYRNLMDGGRVSTSTIEYMQQYGVHPQVAMTEVSGYIQHVAQRIAKHDLPHSNDCLLYTSPSPRDRG